MVRLKAEPPNPGVLVVDKPAGLTSHDVVARARRALDTRAVGHAGTLDPMATGVLVLLVGEATKLSPYVTAETKLYRATVVFGVTTETLDADGRVTETRELEPGWLDVAALELALEAERGRTSQTPPTVSAISTDGERAHRRARRGESFELPARPVTMHSLALLSVGETSVDVELKVSKGFYVRAFARDLGERLGAPAHLSALRRLASGTFTLEDAAGWPLPQVPALLPLTRAIERCLPVAHLSTEGEQRARHGQVLGSSHFEERPAELARIHDAGVVAWLDSGDNAVALGEIRQDTFHVVRGFRQ